MAIPVEVDEAMRCRAAAEGLSIQAAMRQAVEEWLAQHNENYVVGLNAFGQQQGRDDRTVLPFYPMAVHAVLALT